MMDDCSPVTEFDQWYVNYKVDDRTGCLDVRGFSDKAGDLYQLYLQYKREMDARCANYFKYEMLADNQVISPKPDLPNISSGETAGMIRRIARNVVQNTPNVEVISKFDDDQERGVITRAILGEKVIGSDTYGNDMQQNLFSSTVTSLTVGFDCVLPVLLQDGAGSWYIKYDVIHYRDVYPEPGAKDVRQANQVFVRRWLTLGDVKSLVRNQVSGWDIAALKELLKSAPSAREASSAAQQDRKHKRIPDGYDVITWYSNSGDPFLTFSGTHKLLLRIEKNKHPRSEHPVHFLVMEKDPQQPLGKSQVDLLLGRQEFQDLMLNGAMKLWYRNINPTIVSYGAPDAVPTLSPGKYFNISNPNARVEAFEVNTQTLLQYGQISQQNMGSMVNLVGAADQQMASSAGGGMSATPQGVEAQEALVDITTNNYQKAVEAFFGHYCSYALTLYFHELSGVKGMTLNADTRQKLLALGFPMENIGEDGVVKISFKEMATEYFVRCVPGSLIEMEDEKQLRILNELFVPLSQAMPAIAQSGNQEMLANAVAAMQFIVRKQIELSGSMHANELDDLLNKGVQPHLTQYQERADAVEGRVNEFDEIVNNELEQSTSLVAQLQEQVGLIAQTQQAILQALGAQTEPPAVEGNTSRGDTPEPMQ